jgi:hypothetical protein
MQPAQRRARRNFRGRVENREGSTQDKRDGFERRSDRPRRGNMSLNNSYVEMDRMPREEALKRMHEHYQAKEFLRAGRFVLRY